MIIPTEPIGSIPRPGYFIEAMGAHGTEGRLCCRLDPSRGLLRAFVELNNAVLGRFSEAERGRIGVRTCPGPTGR